MHLPQKVEKPSLKLGMGMSHKVMWQTLTLLVSAINSAASLLSQ